MATKTFKVSLSLDNPRIIQSGINVHSFDKQSIKITIELTKDSQAYQIPTGATIRISLLKLARQEQKIIVDVPNTNRDSIDWIVPDYLDGYQGEVRVGVYLIVGTENIDVGYFNITSSVSDIDKAAEEFTESVLQGWDQIEADLAEIRNTIASINTLASDFTADVAIKQSDVTSKYNAFDESVTTANQTIDDILGLADDVQQVSAQLAEKVQNFKLKNEVVNGDFTQGTTGWLPDFSILSAVSNQLNMTHTGLNTTSIAYQNTPLTLVSGKKIYYRAVMQVDNSICTRIRLYTVGSITVGTPQFAQIVESPVENQKYLLSGVVTQPADASGVIQLRLSHAYTSSSVGNNKIMRVEKALAIDLTKLFGAGNEPSKIEMDELMKFIPNGWWNGELSLTQKQFITWQLNLIRKNTNAIIALGGTIV